MKITIKEEVGFEPTRRFTDLTVFKTVPLNLTWVFFHKIVRPTNRTTHWILMSN